MADLGFVSKQSRSLFLTTTLLSKDQPFVWIWVGGTPECHASKDQKALCLVPRHACNLHSELLLHLSTGITYHSFYTQIDCIQVDSWCLYFLVCGPEPQFPYL